MKIRVFNFKAYQMFKNERASVALIFALAFPLIALFSIHVLDFHRAYTAKAYGQVTLDSSILSLSGWMNDNDTTIDEETGKIEITDELIAYIKQRLSSGLNKRYSYQNLTVRNDGSVLEVSYDLIVRNLTSLIHGKTEKIIPIRSAIASSSYEVEGQPLNIVLVVDISTSMYSYIEQLKTAALSAIQKYKESGRNVTFSIIPFWQYTSSPNNGLFLFSVDLETDFFQAETFISNLVPRSDAYPGYYTSVACARDALSVALQTVNQAEEGTNRVVVLLTDWDQYCGSDDGSKECEMIKDAGVTMVAARFGAYAYLQHYFDSCASSLEYSFTTNTASTMFEAFTAGEGGGVKHQWRASLVR